MDLIFAGLDLHDGGVGSGSGNTDFLNDHQIPRSAFPGFLWCDPADVRHPGDLPGLLHSPAIPDADQSQPHDPHRGDLSLCLPGSRHDQPPGSGLQLRLYGRDRDHRYSGVQPRRNHLHGYGVRIFTAKAQRVYEYHFSS